MAGSQLFKHQEEQLMFYVGSETVRAGQARPGDRVMESVGLLMQRHLTGRNLSKVEKLQPGVVLLNHISS